MTRVLGADFSGAAEAGRSIWVTEARETADGLVVENCYRAADEWGAGRECAHAGLRERVTDGFAVAGLDFPFSLPQALLDEHCGGTWRGLLDWLTSEGPDDPDGFATTCRTSARAHSGDGTATLRRETDLRRAGLCPYDEIVTHQTYYGARNVLAWLAPREDVTVAPMQTGAGSAREEASSGARVVEVYPAATFGWLGLYREGYTDDRERRATNVDGIEACSVDLGEFRETFEAEHDALDSLAAAVSAGRALSADPPRYGSREEGHIFV